MNSIFLKMLLILIFTFILPTYIFSQSITYYNTPWSIRMGESVIKRSPDTYKLSGVNKWDYVVGTVLKGVESVWRSTDSIRYFNYIKNTVDVVVNSSGVISGYSESAYNLDMINEGRMLLLLYNATNSIKYKTAADALRKQIKNQPRTSERGFWHKNIYPNQMWLDGLYMASPFYAEYSKIVSESANYDSVANQFIVIEKHTRDNVTGLLYHGWDESKSQSWANKITGCSPNFWGRAIGWFIMGLVDAIEIIPAEHIKQSELRSILKKLADALESYQDPIFGTWYQVVDQGSRAYNYREASVSSMIVYAIAKAVRLGYLSQEYLEIAKKGYTGILTEFVSINSDSTINLDRICSVAGLGGSPYRDGSYEYYTNQISTTPTPIVSNDGKGIGPFIMASVEMERAGFIIPPLKFKAMFNSNNSIMLSWIDRTYNANSFIIERKTSTDSNFSIIGEVKKGLTSYIDNNLSPASKYYYRIRSVSNSLLSDYSALDSVSTSLTKVINDNQLPNEFVLKQNYPNPFNPSTHIEFSLNQKKSTTLRIYDLIGREIETLFSGEPESGKTYNIMWNAEKLTAGIYIIVLESGSQRISKKMTLLK